MIFSTLRQQLPPSPTPSPRSEWLDAVKRAKRLRALQARRASSAARLALETWRSGSLLRRARREGAAILRRRREARLLRAAWGGFYLHAFFGPRLHAEKVRLDVLKSAEFWRATSVTLRALHPSSIRDPPLPN